MLLYLLVFLHSQVGWHSLIQMNIRLLLNLTAISAAHVDGVLPPCLTAVLTWDLVSPSPPLRCSRGICSAAGSRSCWPHPRLAWRVGLGCMRGLLVAKLVARWSVVLLLPHRRSDLSWRVPGSLTNGCPGEIRARPLRGMNMGWHTLLMGPCG